MQLQYLQEKKDIIMSDNNRENIFENCLFFSTNSLARSLDSIANKAFSDMDVTPTEGFTLLCVSDMKIFSPTKISRTLNMSASTITRFIAKLVKLHYLEYHKTGRNVRLELTPLGVAKSVEVKKRWGIIRQKIAKVLPDNESMEITRKINSANKKFILRKSRDIKT